MRHKTIWFLSCLLVLRMASLVRADDPTSRFLPLTPLASSLTPSSTGLTVQFEVWDQASGGTMIFAEAHTVDTRDDSTITNDTGLTDLLLGRGTVRGLVPANFPAGSTRYLDVTQGGVTVLTARLPLYASVFSVSAPNEVPGNLNIVDSTGDAGNILKGGALFLHNFGADNTFLGKNAGNLNTSGAGRNTAVGGSALNSNTTGSYNTASGFGALAFNTTGSFNTADGENALLFNSTGSNNTAAGAIALYRNTTGHSNTAIGFQALQASTTGYENTATGRDALFSNTIGYNNTAIGVQALYSSSDGYFNTAIGDRVLQYNTHGGQNTATGAWALQFNTIGYLNTATGNIALQNNTDGYENTATGANALSANTSGHLNTADGRLALGNNTTGSNNTAIGWYALSNNTTGSNNTAIGTSANVPYPSNLTNATAIGANTVVSASNAMVLGNGVNVGIGVSAPAFKLHVIDSSNTGLRVQTDAAGGTVASFGGNGVFQVDAPGLVGGRLIIKQTGGAGLVGINTNAPDATLSVNGSADKPGGGSWGTFSDARLKTVNGAFSAGLEQILRLHPIRYRYKQENALGISDADEHVGFVAQDVERVIPEAVSRNSQGYLIVNNDPILWSMLNAIQQQQEQITQQRAQIAELQSQLAAASGVRVTKTGGALKAENADLKARLEKLERSIGTLVVKAE